MADPPPIRRTPPTRPPPIPAPRAPIAPAPAKTVADELPEDTRTNAAPDHAELVAQLLGLVATEAAALLAVDDRRLADLNVRTALASWDALNQPDEALRLLELADGHPLVPRLRFAAALSVGDPAALQAAEPGLEGSAGMQIELAEAWLWRHGRVDRAAEICDRLLATELPAIWRAHVGELAALAHATGERWPRVVELRRAAIGADSDPEQVAAAAALVLDRANDPASALAMCWSKLEHFPGPDADALGWLRTFDVAIDAATVLDDSRRFELLDKRAELVGGLPGGALEALATRHAVASELERDGQLSEAAAAWMALADDEIAQTAGAARRVALLRATWAAIGSTAAADRRIALDAHRKLADSECTEVAAAHAWRALELAALDARSAGSDNAVRRGKDARSEASGGGNPTRSDTTVRGTAPRGIGAQSEASGGGPTCIDNAVPGSAPRGIDDGSAAAIADLARAVNDVVGSAVAERWLDQIELDNPGAAAIARFETRGGLAVRWAAAIAERNGEPTMARRLWARAATEASPGSHLTLPTSRDHLLRLRRREHPDQLSETYAAAARAELDARCSSALWCARGVVDLARGDLASAEDALKRAADLAPDDAFSRAALAAAYRRDRRTDVLARALAELSTKLASRELRVQAARETAAVLDELGDRPGARAALDRLLVDRPDDADAMLALATLCDRDELWPRAIELREAAAGLLPGRCADLWIEVAAIHERRGDRARALSALATAAEHDHPDAPRARVRLYRQAGELEPALAIARAELAADPSLARRAQLQNEIAQLLVALDREPEAVVAAYLDVLSLEPDQTDALAGIEQPARKLAMWDELARAFRGAPQTPHNLEVLAEALANIAEWPELAEVRRRQLAAATSPDDQANRAAELARLLEHELGDGDGAIRMLHVAQAAAHDDARQRALLRLLRAAQRWSDVASTLERELPTVSPVDVDRQVAILLELAEVRAGPLDRASEAIQAYDAVLECRPGNAIATAALEALYGRTGRDRELARLLEARAESVSDPGARASLFARVAQLRADRDDVDGAIAAYAAAFAADPTSREVFTAFERVCYKAERWTAAMQLYENAIRHVERGQSRTYRLGDLYARRGNVELNFLGQFDAAIASYQRVIEIDSQPAAAVAALEGMCRDRDDWQPLIAAYESRGEAQKDPQRRAEAIRAAAQLAQRHSGDAAYVVRLNRKLLAIDPMDAGAQLALERFYDDHQDSSGLVEVLKLRLQHAKNLDESIQILKRIARTSEDGARDVATATEHYQKILELRDNDRDALDALCRIYESTEQWAEFIEVTRKLIKLTSDRNTRALLYFRCGSVLEAKFAREHDAIRYYHEAIKTSSACLPAIHGLRDLYRRREEWPRVIETLELEVKVWQDDKERAGVFAQIGRIYEKQLADIDHAMHFYDSALAVDPECLPANEALFEHFFDRDDWGKAHPIGVALAQKAMREGDPTTRSEFFRKRGVVARMTGDPHGAADSLVYALEIRPTNASALDDLGALAREQPDAWDFEATYRELDKLYRKRDDADPLLARVHVGRAAIIERAGDLDQAADLYRQALELAPGDIAVLSSLVGFHSDMRHWSEAIAAIERFVGGNAAAPADRLTALMRRAAIHADGEMDANRAIAVLHEVIRHEPSHQEAHYLLAQQCFLIGRYPDARAAIDRVIELATSPGMALEAPALARYYYYKGRILDTAGDPRSATSQYRRAIDYDPGYAPPALVLARRAADAGDQRQAETLLIEAAHAAMAQGGPRAAVPLQRGLARILLASGDRPAAIEAYRGILNVEPDGASDRVALAEIYAVDDPQRAISELRKVLDRDIHHAPAYRLLSSFHSRLGEPDRAARVLTALDLLGFAEPSDRAMMQRLRGVLASEPFVRPLDETQRERYLMTAAARAPLGEIFAVLAEQLTNLVVQPSLGTNLMAVDADSQPRLVYLASQIGPLYQTGAELYVGDAVPGLAAVTAFPRRLLVIDRSLLDESDAALRFLIGYAFEAIRGGYATLLQVGARQRRELAMLLRSLVANDAGDITGPAADLVDDMSPEAHQVLERHAGVRDVDPGAWSDGMLALAKRAGLVACDDFSAAIWMVARLSGELLPSRDATVALGAVLGGSDLVRFYLSDDYQHLRDVLTT